MDEQVNKTWNTEGRFQRYEEAVEKLVSFTGDNSSRETETHLYKIKRMNSDDHYVVKSWTKPLEQKTKKAKKSRKSKNKKQSNNTRS